MALRRRVAGGVVGLVRGRDPLVVCGLRTGLAAWADTLRDAGADMDWLKMPPLTLLAAAVAVVVEAQACGAKDEGDDAGRSPAAQV